MMQKSPVTYPVKPRNYDFWMLFNLLAKNYWNIIYISAINSWQGLPFHENQLQFIPVCLQK